VAVVAPSGTFQQSFATATPLAEWAKAAGELRAPRIAPADSNNSADTARASRFASVLLNEPGDSAAHFDLTEFRLTRVDGDSTPDYLLSGTNGAWTFELRLGFAQFTALLGALRGDPNAGASPYDLARLGDTPAEAKPDITGAFLDMQVDRPAQRDGEPVVVYPASLQGSGVTGDVRLSFIISETGRAQPWSVRLIGKAHPLLAAAARNALLTTTFRPAQIGGRPVPQHAMQDFQFR
jgi:TonB family protein